MITLTCMECGAEYAAEDYTAAACTAEAPRRRRRCGGLLDVRFHPRFPLDKIEKRKPTMWRYREAIPIENDAFIVSFEEGFTPLLQMAVAGRAVWVKQEHLFPTGSYKDRGASVLISRARALGIAHVVEDSSGNAGSAVAAYCARAGIGCDIFVPASTSPGKLAQITAYGANLNKIPGSREDTADAVLKAAEQHFYASHSWNPFFFHGTKTFAFEVCEQLGWRAPDTVILPVGNGTLLLGAYIGFNELLAAGITQKAPRIIAVQAANCAPLHRAFKENLDTIPHINGKKTTAEGIAIAAPIRGKQILAAVRRTGGDFIAVNEKEIEAAWKETCGRGFYIEPTSAAAAAGVRRYIEETAPPADELIVSVFTGHGLKHPRGV